MLHPEPDGISAIQDCQTKPPPHQKRNLGKVRQKMNNESKGQTSASSMQLETKITHQCLLIKHKLFIV